MITIVHLVGDADLGINPSTSEEKRAACKAILLGGSDAEKKILLENASGSAEREFQPPLEAVRDKIGQETCQLVLIVTAQEPAHEKDTKIIGEAIKSVLESSPEAFGGRFECAELITVDGIDTETIGGAVKDRAAKGFDEATTVVATIAGGAIQSSVGVLGGLLAGGVVPELWILNQQDRTSEQAQRGELVETLSIDVDPTKWLARTRRYDALANTNTDQGRLWGALDRASRGKWHGNRFDAGMVHFREFARQLDVARVGRTSEVRGEQAERQAARDLVGGELRNWITESVGKDDASGGDGGEWKASIRRLVIAQAAARNPAGPGFAELVYVTDPNLDGHGVAPGARHGLNLSRPDSFVSTMVDRGITHDAAEDAAVTALGLLPPSRLGANRTLVVFPVGTKTLDPNRVMFDAVRAQPNLVSPIFLLIASSQTKEVAEQLQQTVMGNGAHAVCVIQDVHAGGKACKEEIKDFLPRVDLRDIVEIRVHVGPGTKMLTVGMLLACAETAFEIDARLAVRSISAARNADGTINENATTVKQPSLVLDGWKNLLPDKAIGTVVGAALKRLDISMLDEALTMASASWKELRDDVRKLRILLDGSLDPTAPEALGAAKRAGVSANELLKARIKLVHQFWSEDPQLTPVRLAITISDVLPDSGDDRWYRLGGAPRVVWDERNRVFHFPWGEPSSAPNLDALLEGLGLANVEDTPVLTDLVASIKRRVDIS